MSVSERSEVISGIHEFGSRRGDPLLPRKLLGALYGGCCNFRKASHCLPRESFLAGLPVSLSKFVKDGFGIGLHRSGFQKRDCLRCLPHPQVGQSQSCLPRQAAWREGNCPLEIRDGVPYPSQAKQCITKLEIYFCGFRISPKELLEQRQRFLIVVIQPQRPGEALLQPLISRRKRSRFFPFRDGGMVLPLEVVGFGHQLVNFGRLWHLGKPPERAKRELLAGAGLPIIRGGIRVILRLRDDLPIAARQKAAGQGVLSAIRWRQVSLALVFSGSPIAVTGVAIDFG